MYQYSLSEWLLLFYFYSLFGWCFESAYVSLRTGHWVNRGFMRAPFLPLYGSGALVLLIVSIPFRSNLVLTYLSGCVGAVLLEYLVGVMMEALYKIKYWDYGRQRCNYDGHICLSSTIAWGLLTLLMVYVIHEPVSDIIMQIPAILKFTLTWIITVVLAKDFVISFGEAMALKKVLVNLEKIESSDGKINSLICSQVEESREDIQAELTAKYEVKISKEVL